MNTIAGAMIDEDVLDWLDNFNAHDQKKIAEAINQLAYAHRAELSIPHMNDDEDIAALSHADLFKILSLASPDTECDLTLSNVQMLGLAMSAMGVIEYSLPALNSPIMIKRKFADERRKNLIGCTGNRDLIIKALNEWICGLRDIDLTNAGEPEFPDVAGMYLVLDEHKQLRYGRLFKNGGEGWTFCESYADGSSTCWYSSDTKHMQEDDLPISLLSNWVLVSEWYSPAVKAAQKATPLHISATHRIFMFLRSLSPHVKAEMVAHFDGIIDRSLHSVDAIGRLTESEWRQAAQAVADDEKLSENVSSWLHADTWLCFIAVVESLGFNIETRQFDPQYDYQANDDHLESEDD